MHDFPRLPKLCGADIELGNFVHGREATPGTESYAVRRLLRQFDGIPTPSRYGSYEVTWVSGGGDTRAEPGTHGESGCDVYGSGGNGGWSSDAGGWDPRDIGRRFLPSNGGCVYEDLSHLELCLPEVLSPFDWVAAWSAMLRLTRDAVEAANRLEDPAHPIKVLVNNSDGLGHSYGSHLDFLVTRRAWYQLFHRKLLHQAVLASFQVSGIVLTGQGKVGSENGAPPVDFQITQRGDFFERLLGSITTHRRPLLNTRDEPLCGMAGIANGKGGKDAVDAARLHVIFPDSTLCPVASLLKVGTAQIVLAMLECESIDPSLALDDPLEALTRWGHDPTLSATARLMSGRSATAVELQQGFLASARRFVEDGGCEGVVPRAKEVIDLWEDTLERLDAGDLDGLFGRLDWVTKWMLLRDAMRSRPHLGWHSPEIKHLDHHYASLTDGLFRALEEDGAVAPVVREVDVQRLCRQPPPDTRAWGRAMLLRLGGTEGVTVVDWDVVGLRLPGKDRWSVLHRTVELSDPLGWTRRELEPVIAASESVPDLLERMGAKP